MILSWNGLKVEYPKEMQSDPEVVVDTDELGKIKSITIKRRSDIPPTVGYLSLKNKPRFRFKKLKNVPSYDG